MEYKLSNEKICVKFQSLGGALSSIQDMEGVEYLWQGDAAYWSGQAPVLFPICGSIRDDRANIGENKITTMPRHGIVRKKEFTCTKQTENSIVFSIKSNEEMYKQYPYKFQLDITYTLEDNKIIITYTIFNLDNDKMPFFIGGHPGFRCPLFENEEYSDYYLEFEEKENCTVPTPVTATGLIDVAHRTPFLNGEKTLPLTHDLFAEDAIIFDELKSRKVILASSKNEKKIEVEFRDFPYLILWSTANKGPFLAIEPWVGLSTCSDEGDIFEEKRNVQILEPGQEKDYTFSICISV